jgi:hypothetical protein
VLNPKRDHLIRLFNRVGLAARQLTDQQLVKLFFASYNADVPPPDTATVEGAMKQ